MLPNKNDGAIDYAHFAKQRMRDVGRRICSHNSLLATMCLVVVGTVFIMYGPQYYGGIGRKVLDGAEMPVHFRWQGTVYSVDVPASATLGELHQRIRQTLGHAIDGIFLVLSLAGSILFDGSTELSDLGICAEAEIDVSVATGELEWWLHIYFKRETENSPWYYWSVEIDHGDPAINNGNPVYDIPAELDDIVEQLSDKEVGFRGEGNELWDDLRDLVRKAGYSYSLPALPQDIEERWDICIEKKLENESE